MFVLQDSLGACAPQVSGVELESMISSVKDLLPALGDGFIEVKLPLVSSTFEFKVCRFCNRFRYFFGH